jgi:hypothetical protein
MAATSPELPEPKAPSTADILETAGVPLVKGASVVVGRVVATEEVGSPPVVVVVVVVDGRPFTTRSKMMTATTTKIMVRVRAEGMRLGEPPAPPRESLGMLKREVRAGATGAA